MNEETLFHLARGKPAGERAAFLEQACAGDEALRHRARVLLHAHDHPAGILGEPAVNLGPPADASAAEGGEHGCADGSRGFAE
jgi:hypothetical protein